MHGPTISIADILLDVVLRYQLLSDRKLLRASTSSLFHADVYAGDNMCTELGILHWCNVAG